MKKANLFLLFLLGFVLIFTGCDSNGSELSEEDVSTIALASMGTSLLGMMFIGESDGTYDSTSPNWIGEILSGSFEVSGSGTVVTLSACGFDMDETVGVDFTLNGEISYAVPSQDEITITYTGFSLTGIMPGTTDELSMTASGTFSMTSTGATVNITITGLTDDPCVVVIVMPQIGESGPTEITSATINGVDYTAEFNTALEEF